MASALILGASGDIGQAACRQLASEGWSLYLHYYQHEEQARTLANELQRTYPKQDFFLVQLDLNDESKVKQFCQNIFNVQAVIFASGITHYGLFIVNSSIQLDDLWHIHVKTPMLIIQQLQNKLAQSKHGRILFIGSVYGAVGSAMEVAYSTVKGAQTAFANAYAKEVASLGITVNVIAPGAIDTKMNQEFDESQKELLTSEIPAARMGTTDEIAYWIKCVVDEHADYLTGQTIYVDGGWLK